MGVGMVVRRVVRGGVEDGTEEDEQGSPGAKAQRSQAECAGPLLIQRRVNGCAAVPLSLNEREALARALIRCLLSRGLTPSV